MRVSNETRAIMAMVAYQGEIDRNNMEHTTGSLRAIAWEETAALLAAAPEDAGEPIRSSLPAPINPAVLARLEGLEKLYRHALNHVASPWHPQFASEYAELPPLPASLVAPEPTEEEGSATPHSARVAGLDEITEEEWLAAYRTTPVNGLSLPLFCRAVAQTAQRLANERGMR